MFFSNDSVCRACARDPLGRQILTRPNSPTSNVADNVNVGDISTGDITVANVGNAADVSGDVASAIAIPVAQTVGEYYGQIFKFKNQVI